MASDAECAALALRLRLPAVRSLRCRFRLSPAPAGRALADAFLEAEIEQTCVVSLEDFPATIAERFAVRFVPEGAESDDPDPESVDEIPYQDGVLDLGEAAAVQLALALDPYPRAPGVVLADLARDAEEPDTAPFARLGEVRHRQ